MAGQNGSTAIGRPRSGRHRVVIVGGGFGGINAAFALRRADADVTLVDRRNFHLFQPLLYQVATGALSPANIASPLRALLHRQKNCDVLLAEVVGFDVAGRRVLLAGGHDLPYDSLIVAAGSTHSYFGRDDWAGIAPGLKTIEDATEIRRRVLYAFEHAEWETDPEARRAWMTFVIVGGGPTGVELAGALSEVARKTLRRDFRHINPSDARILLVDASDRVLSAFPPDLSEHAHRDLAHLKVEVRPHTLVTDVAEGSVTLGHRGPAESGKPPERIATWTVLWAAGVQASPLARKLADAAGAEVDRAGRIKILPDLTVPNHPEIFPIGDLANCPGPDGKPLPGVAPTAIQQGQFAAAVIKARIAGTDPPKVFKYKDYGMMATIGRRKAVAQLGKLKFTGAIAWLLWLLVHLMSLVKFENRLLVLFQWGWSYITYNRTARLITGKELPVKTRVAPEPAAASIGDTTAGDTDHGGTAAVQQAMPVPAGRS